MTIAYSKDGAAPNFIPSHFAPAFYRAFRAELWLSGIKRDPKEGDEVLGVKIVSLTI